MEVGIRPKSIQIYTSMAWKIHATLQFQAWSAFISRNENFFFFNDDIQLLFRSINVYNGPEIIVSWTSQRSRCSSSDECPKRRWKFKQQTSKDQWWKKLQSRYNIKDKVNEWPSLVCKIPVSKVFFALCEPRLKKLTALTFTKLPVVKYKFPWGEIHIVKRNIGNKG